MDCLFSREFSDTMKNKTIITSGGKLMQKKNNKHLWSVIFYFIFKCTCLSANAGLFADVVYDIREYNIHHPANKKDGDGNTQLHIFVQHYNDYITLEEVSAVLRTRVLMQEGRNPYIQNSAGKSASQEAFELFEKTGNYICGYMVAYLKMLEAAYLLAYLDQNHIL